MAELRFLADEMLGSLARWLRIMGHDTEYARGMRDGDILVRSREEGRILLTRDRQLAERAGAGGMLLSTDDAPQQLSDVIRRFSLVFELTRTRCAKCNGRLEMRSGEGMEGKVPPRVLERHREFLVCPLCGQIYWKGTHWTRIVDQIEEALRRSRVSNGPR